MSNTLMHKKQCPECRDSGQDNLAVYSDNSEYCFGCGYFKSSKEVSKGVVLSTDLIPVGEYKGLPRRRISSKVCEMYGVFRAKSKSGEDILVFPHTKDGVVVSQKVKTPDKKIWWVGSNKDVDYFGKSIHNGNKKRLVITEGEEDCLAVMQTIGIGHVTTLTNGANDVEKFINKHYKSLIEYEHIVLCFDNDPQGRAATDKFIEIFPKGKVSVAKISEKDACEMLIKGKEDELKWAVLKSEVIRPDGVMSMQDLGDDYFNVSLPKGIDTIFPMLNKALLGLRKGELTMISAGSGLGKSTVCTNMIYDFIINKGLTVADIKLEEDQRLSIYNYLAMYAGVRPIEFRENTSIVSQEVKESFKKDFKNLYIHDHFGSLDGNNLLNILDYYATVLKVDFIFLDHISIAISGTDSSKEGERKDIDKLLTKIRELINRTKVGFVCVSHLSNPPRIEKQWEQGRRVKRSDLRGSGSLAQISDNIIAIEGDVTDEFYKEIRNIRLLKTRYGSGQELLCDSFKYDLLTGRTIVGNFAINEEDDDEDFLEYE